MSLNVSEFKTDFQDEVKYTMIYEGSGVAVGKFSAAKTPGVIVKAT